MKALKQISPALAFVATLFAMMPVFAIQTETPKCSRVVREAAQSFPGVFSGKWNVREERVVQRLNEEGDQVLLSLAEEAVENPQAVAVMGRLAETKKLSPTSVALLVDLLQALAEGWIAFPFEYEEFNTEAQIVMARRKWSSEALEVDALSRVRALQVLSWVYKSLEGQVPREDNHRLATWIVSFGYRILDDSSFPPSPEVTRGDDRLRVTWHQRMLTSLMNLTASFLITKPSDQDRQHLRNSLIDLRKLLKAQISLAGVELAYDPTLDRMIRDNILFARVHDRIPDAENSELKNAQKVAVGSDFPNELRSAALSEMLRILDRYFLMGIKKLDKQRKALEQAHDQLSENAREALGGLFEDVLAKLDEKMVDAVLFFDLWVHGTEGQEDLDRRIFPPNYEQPIVDAMFEGLVVEAHSAEISRLIVSRWKRQEDHPDRIQTMRDLISSAYHDSNRGVPRLQKEAQERRSPSLALSEAIETLEELRLPIGLRNLRSTVAAQINNWPAEAREEVEWLMSASSSELLEVGDRWGSFASTDPIAFLKAMRAFRSSFGGDSAPIRQPDTDPPGGVSTLSYSTSSFDQRGLPTRFDELILNRYRQLTMAVEYDRANDLASQLMLPSTSDLDGLLGYGIEVKRYAALYFILLELRWNRLGQTFGRMQWTHLMDLYRDARLND